VFAGLAIYQQWDWSVRHPVLRLDFSSGNFSAPGDLHKDVTAQLDAMDSKAAVTAGCDTTASRFRNLLKTLHQQTGQRLAVLIDEYDKPILDALAAPEVARANRDFLRGLYSTIKFGDAHIKFTFLTGVSKFSKVSLFSGFNNLIDITLEPRYSAICGYTEADLDSVFAPELLGLDRKEIRAWYNGYNWLGEEAVYNPFDVLLLFRRRAFAAYWFETGTPTFLLETLLARRVSSLALDDMFGSEELLSAFDVDHMATEVLLIRRREPRGGRMYYRLGYPNREARQSLNESLLNHLTGNPSRQAEHRPRLYDLLLANDFDGLERLLEGFFASIPYQWHTNNKMANYEGYYASVFYSYFASLGLAITVEDSSQAGRLDMAVEFNENVYLFDFKVVEQAATGAALGQLPARDYAAKYRGRGTAIYLIGVEFSRQTHEAVA